MPAPAEFAPAPPDILAIVGALITAHFPQLATARLAVLVRAEPEDAGKGEDGQPMQTVAAAGVNSDKAAQFEYIIWFALNVWQLLDERERDAIVFHELEHCGRDAAGKAHLMPHDESVFTREVELYGAWWAGAHEKLKQLNAQQGEKE